MLIHYLIANGDGVWEGTFSLAPGSFEYIYCADGWAQNETAGLIAEMQAGGTCAPVTDYASYANRLRVVAVWSYVQQLILGDHVLHV